jgi:formate dehydrogenase maturation protein FdhE
VETAFRARAERAERLEPSCAAAAEPLRFAAGLYRAQGALAAAVEASHAERALTGRLADDAPRLSSGFADVLGFAAEHGPPALVEAARTRAHQDPEAARRPLLQWWSGASDTAEDYLSRALLRPYVEVLARVEVAPDRPRGAGRCPFCGGAPWIAARRPEPGTDGARRVLGCALCGGEWTLGRILCPSCGEGDPARLPSFQTDTYPGVRIEACEACRRYVKSLDLTADARIVPEVDDLVSLGLDLWAASKGFERIEPGLAGL